MWIQVSGFWLQHRTKNVLGLWSSLYDPVSVGANEVLGPFRKKSNVKTVLSAENGPMKLLHTPECVSLPIYNV